MARPQNARKPMSRHISSLEGPVHPKGQIISVWEFDKSMRKGGNGLLQVRRCFFDRCSMHAMARNRSQSSSGSLELFKELSEERTLCR